MVSLRALHDSDRLNALLGWMATAVVVLTAIGSALTGAFIWSGFALVLAAVSVLPVVWSGDWRMMVPWPLLTVGALAVLLRAVGPFNDTAGYVAITALALVVVVELETYTPVTMSRRFAIGFAVLTTMALEGLWTITQFYSDVWFGTDFIISQTDLQWDFVLVAVVAFAMGGFFEWYFDRIEHVGSRAHPTLEETG